MEELKKFLHFIESTIRIADSKSNVSPFTINKEGNQL